MNSSTTAAVKRCSKRYFGARLTKMGMAIESMLCGIVVALPATWYPHPDDQISHNVTSPASVALDLLRLRFAERNDTPCAFPPSPLRTVWRGAPGEDDVGRNTEAASVTLL